MQSIFPHAFSSGIISFISNLYYINLYFVTTYVLNQVSYHLHTHYTFKIGDEIFSPN